MRRINKKSLMELINSLYESHKLIEDYINNSEKNNAKLLMNQCQETAIDIVKYFIANEKEYANDIAVILSQYCEKIYINLESLDVNFISVLEDIIKSTEELIDKIPLKKEVVFMPYKASMWDSLESVWEETNKDPECNAVVIPLPYYDKNPDGSLGEFHYDGNEYPDYVPVINYNDYNLSKNHPDKIYIHNPYDDLNFITTVDARYYSNILKRHTDELVYIPYFILDENASMDTIMDFCLKPGVINADKVIVQSEKIRQMYIDVLIQYYNGALSREELEKKVLGTGSPKIERLMKINKEDVEIPDNWLSKIKTADGKRKKIIFYNTSVSTFIIHEEKYIKKLKSVLKIFKDNIDNVTLLWRPHPLLRATVNSMCPELLDEFDRIVFKYKSEDWGIYDDSADLDRAVVISDAYYGDWSSVVQLCQKKKMPILIQSVNN